MSRERLQMIGAIFGVVVMRSLRCRAGPRRELWRPRLMAGGFQPGDRVTGGFVTCERLLVTDAIFGSALNGFLSKQRA